ncbi:hypothetical protein NUW58_g9363 [Xylaria curta]|uniref:Uncharacterized protein n=1 Tax=Xylaria curta TaxID=42375 RepID=A0ACC1MYB9_9PEZI|nr:hypothetical protein NUW58_g9363 [Xylaria curta]
MKMNPQPKEELARDQPGAGRGSENDKVSEPRKGGTIEWQMTGKDEVGGIQLQIIPQFRLGRMFAGSMKDACPRECNGVLESYQPVPHDAVVYNVLKTPEELGLGEGDYIHVREFEPRPIPEWERTDSKGPGIRYRMANRKETRRKIVADLATESPFSSETLELEAVRNPLRERILTVRGANANKGPLRFRIDVDDDFSDIRAVARDVFEMPDGELSVLGLVANNPHILFPVKGWGDFLFATEPAVFYHEFRKPRTFDHLEPVTKEFNLVLAPSTDKWRNTCHVNFLNGTNKHFGNINKPLMLEIPHGSTIADVRRLVQETTGSSTEGFILASPDNIDVVDNGVIYGDRRMREDFPDARRFENYTSPILTLAISDGVCLNIKTLTGKVFGFRVSTEDTIQTVKLRIQEMEDIPLDQQRLIFRCRQLENEQTLQDYGIKLCATLHLVLRLRGGGYPSIKVKLAGAIVFNGYPATIGSLKVKLFEQLGIFPHRQDLGHPDDFILVHQDLTLELHILPQERKPLGLGAGGSILQEIHADTSDPRIWDVGSSKILYVHIVNSHDFEDITGQPPPKTPVTWELYANLQLPYDRAWEQRQSDSILDVKGKGVSSDGMFDRLVGLEEEDYADSEMQRVSPKSESDHHSGDMSNGAVIVEEEDSSESEGRYEPPDAWNVPKFPLVLLETDQTVPWFEALGRT